eukprot:3029727-Rhodomonas_salina.1
MSSHQSQPSKGKGQLLKTEGGRELTCEVFLLLFYNFVIGQPKVTVSGNFIETHFSSYFCVVKRTQRAKGDYDSEWHAL